ncbi:heat shock protein 70 family member [Heterostelium album PN500]|uniref:Heat shock protein 70 family member n=1 Tax=Heterostelium pallidum (strain ATCC 26659 / Pp 5 / PN500) TaxID=670386 RepID=D3BQN8_HETP5|nr:heat shock protein 70 family member [Heterostelium album PN500]EFA76458.1 heat shock protein 70 family member [Heterostelium album PN500]|eukprot:XP_020428590.1 heat shock protein 70 family member [Heterostelium album PN500]
MLIDHLLLFLPGFISTSNASVIGIDLGTQSFKIGLISPGKYEMVLNEQSQRKTPHQVGWFREERVFGSDAFSLWVRNPKQVYSLYEPLVGTIYRDGILEEIGMGSLGYSVSNDTERNTFKVKYSDDVYYTPEELLAMTLRRIKELASNYIHGNVKECVIAIPPWLTSTQRQAVLDAASMSGLNVLSLVHSINAASLNFATDREFERNQTAIFYDMGAKSTKLSLVHFSSHTEVKNKKNRTVTNNVVKSMDWDENLGGLNFDMVIVEYLKAKLKKQDSSVDTDDLKLTIKLLKEASKMKETLSVNQQAHIFIGGIQGDTDFSSAITRTEFEELAAPLFERAVAPLKRIIEANGLNPSDIDFVELIGGCSRIPGVQAALKAYLKREVLDKHLNGDEAVASGATFYAASLSHYFRVKDIRLKDITPFGIDVKLVQQPQTVLSQQQQQDEQQVEQSNDDDESSPSSNSNSNNNSPVFFRKNNRINIKKSLTFYSNQSFSVNISYSDVQPSSIAYYTVSNIPVASDNLNFTGKPKITCSIRLNSNGMAILEKAEAEITVFTQRVKSTPSSSNSTSNSSSASTASADGTTTTEESTETKPTGESTPPVTELVSRVHRIPLNISVVYSVVQPLTREQLATMNVRLNQLDAKDKSLRDLRHEKNNIEAFIYETRDKLDSEEYQACSTPEERETFLADIDVTSQWLSDANDNSLEDIVEFQNQYRDIKKKGDKIFRRVSEKANIPGALEELQTLLTKLKPLVANLTKDMEKPEDAKRITDKVEQLEKWIKEKKSEFDSADFTKDLSFSSADIKFKFYDIEKTVKDQLKLKKRPPPKKPSTTTKPKDGKSSSSSNTANKEDVPPTTDNNTEDVPTNNNNEQTIDIEQQDQQDQQQQKEDTKNSMFDEDGGSEDDNENQPKKSTQNGHDEL